MFQFETGIKSPTPIGNIPYLEQESSVQVNYPMHPAFDTFHPTGFHTVNAYIMASDPGSLIDFYLHAFYAEDLGRTVDPDTGVIRNCIMKVGDSCFMIGQARGEFEGMRASFYLFVKDVDEMHARAVEHGAGVVFEPADMDYGDRQSGIIDPAGNYWWISSRLEETEY